MAFKKLEASSSGTTPFFAEYIKGLSPEFINFLNGKLMSPKFIKAVSSGKGFMINFDDEFMIFVWKSSALGNVIKKTIAEESGYLMLLEFSIGKKGLTYDIGYDEEVEVALTEDKFDEGIYYQESTNGDPSPIAPDDHRRSLLDIPLMSPRPEVKFTTTKQAEPSTKPRSNGGRVKLPS